MKNLLKVFAIPTIFVSLLGSHHHHQEAKTDTNVQHVDSADKKKLAKRKLKWECKNCTPNEKVVLDFLQERGISDKVALSVIMGNIQQESMFNPNICEGGARVSYNQCHRGGFGLIQWTTVGRYRGLGHFASKYGGNPSELTTQLRYMVNEPQWVSAEKTFKKKGLNQGQYMNAAYRWLGWGVHGNRTHYSNQFLNRLYQVDL